MPVKLVFFSTNCSFMTFFLSFLLRHWMPSGGVSKKFGVNISKNDEKRAFPNKISCVAFRTCQRQKSGGECWWRLRERLRKEGLARNGAWVMFGKYLCKTSTTIQPNGLSAHNLMINCCSMAFLSTTFYNLLQRAPVKKAFWAMARSKITFKNSQKLRPWASFNDDQDVELSR